MPSAGARSARSFEGLVLLAGHGSALRGKLQVPPLRPFGAPGGVTSFQEARWLVREHSASLNRRYEEGDGSGGWPPRRGVLSLESGDEEDDGGVGDDDDGEESKGEFVGRI